MSLILKPSRYAHGEGHTDVCYFTGETRGLLTCGKDGDVRSWLSLMDDDPTANCISEQVVAVISKNNKVYVATDNNTVQILSYPDLEKQGIITRFTSTVCALATAKTGNLIVSGACDMRIHVSNVDTSDTIELDGHEGQILGLSLDPQEQYVASSSTDGSIRVWAIAEKRLVHIWNNIVPKGNSFFTCKIHSTPSFQPEDGKTLAFPNGKEVIVVERTSWKELFKLRCPDLKAELSICKFSQCGTLMLATSTQGEIVVWDVESKEQIGYIEQDRKVKITSIVWSLDKPTEIAFCNSLGMLGCIEVIANPVEEVFPKSADSDHLDEDLDNIVENYEDGTDMDDRDNVISLDKIKAAVNLENDDDSRKPIVQHSRTGVDSYHQRLQSEIKAQEPFQPGSTPIHLLNRYMIWNNTGIVKCFSSEDRQESSIEVEFHDTSIHHPIHIKNYLQHTLAALSPKALALACSENDETPSKLVVIRLQGWGSGNKEWSIDLPEGEVPLCLAAGDNFVALATSRRRLRLFTASGTQRGIIALPGAPVALNALGHHLVAVCHAGTSVNFTSIKEEQYMTMMWLQIRGTNVRNRSMAVPLSDTNVKLVWVGLTDRGSPTIMDDDGVIAIYDAKSSLWNVACDTANQYKGASDHFFLIGVSETNKMVRCVLCRGSLYPPTTPCPTQIEIPLQLPLCEPDSVKSQLEAKLWQVGGDAQKDEETILSLFVLACRGKADFRAVDICEEFASRKVLELTIKYAGRLNQMALVTKLQSLSSIKEALEIEKEEDVRSVRGKNGSTTEPVEHEYQNIDNDDDDDLMLSLSAEAKPTTVEIKPLSFMKRHNPFRKSGAPPVLKGLQAMNSLPGKPCVASPAETRPQKPKSVVKSKPKESFVVWYGKNKAELAEEFPELDDKKVTMIALARYKETEKADAPTTSSLAEITRESKKRKISDTIKP